MKSKVQLLPNMEDTKYWNNPPEANVCSKCGSPALLGGTVWFEWWQHFIACSNEMCSEHYNRINSGMAPIEDIIKLWNERNPEKMANMQELRKKNHWSLHCNFCGKDVFWHPLDYFMLKEDVWQQVCNNDYVSPNHVLCRHCVEEILGRKLTNADFTDAPINYEYDKADNKILKNDIYVYDEYDWNKFKNIVNIYLDEKQIACAEFEDKISFNEFDFYKNGDIVLYHLDKVIYKNKSYTQMLNIIHSLYGD